MPADWAMTQNVLAMRLKSLSALRKDAVILAEAKAAVLLALEMDATHADDFGLARLGPRQIGVVHCGRIGRRFRKVSGSGGGRKLPFGRFPPAGAIIFPRSGITSNLADKANKLSIPLLDHREGGA